MSSTEEGEGEEAGEADHFHHLYPSFLDAATNISWNQPSV
jgi:hypothetical protein